MHSRSCIIAITRSMYKHILYSHYKMFCADVKLSHVLLFIGYHVLSVCGLETTPTS